MSTTELIAAIVEDARAALADGINFLDIDSVPLPSWASHAELAIDRIDRTGYLILKRELPGTAVLTEGTRFDIATGEVVAGGWPLKLVFDGEAEVTDLSAALDEIDSFRAAVQQALTESGARA